MIAIRRLISIKKKHFNRQTPPKILIHSKKRNLRELKSKHLRECAHVIQKQAKFKQFNAKNKGNT